MTVALTCPFQPPYAPNVSILLVWFVNHNYQRDYGTIHRGRDYSCDYLMVCQTPRIAHMCDERDMTAQASAPWCNQEPRTCERHACAVWNAFSMGKALSRAVGSIRMVVSLGAAASVHRHTVDETQPGLAERAVAGGEGQLQLIPRFTVGKCPLPQARERSHPGCPARR